MGVCKIRPAVPADCCEILAMIRELADFERLLHEAVASEADIRHGLFSANAKTEALVAEDAAGQIQGFALFFTTYSTFLGREGLYLEDLYVRPSARGSGMGLELLRALATTALERGCGRLEWSVLDWNEKAIEFYEKLGARPVDGWTRYRMGPEEIRALAPAKASP